MHSFFEEQGFYTLLNLNIRNTKIPIQSFFCYRYQPKSFLFYGVKFTSTAAGIHSFEPMD